MNRGMRWILCGVMAIALLLLGLLGADLLRDRQRIITLRAELKESQDTWKGIAEEKEALQAELKTVTEALKEANQTLEDLENSKKRTEELRAEMETPGN